MTSIGYGNFSSNVSAYIPRSSVSTGKGNYSVSQPTHTVMDGNVHCNACNVGMYRMQRSCAVFNIILRL